MRRTTVIEIGAAALVAAAFGINATYLVPRTSYLEPSASYQVPSTKYDVMIPINADTFVDHNRFLATGSATGTKLVGAPIAGVVNHHVLAADLISRFFRTLKASRPGVTRFIILSPDHFKAGTDTVEVGDVAFTSDGKTVKTDADAVKLLTSRRVASLADPYLFEKEHGIGALMPFLIRDFPDASVVPIVIRGDVPRDRMDALGVELAHLIDGKTFVIVSSDMSHYLAEGEALRNDIRTTSWLASLDRDRFRSATDDYTDSGPALIAISSMFDGLKSKPTFTVIGHSISSRYGGDPSYTTSYIDGFWTVGD